MDCLTETQVPGDELPGKVAPADSPPVFVEAVDCRHRDAVVRVARESFPQPWGPQDFAYFLAHPQRLCLGAFGPGRPKRLKAYFLALLVCGDLDIISIATDPRFRRQGLGRCLVLGALSDPRVERAFLEVEVGNDQAAALYESCGFKRIGRRAGYYGPGRDGLLMVWHRPAVA